MVDIKITLDKDEWEFEVKDDLDVSEIRHMVEVLSFYAPDLKLEEGGE